MTARLAYNDPIIRGLRLPRVIDFLVRTGWERVEHPNDRIDLFQTTLHPNDPPFNIVLPRHTEFSDLYERLADAVSMLSSIHQIEPELMCQRLAAVGDILALRLVDAPDLTVAPKIMHSLREIVGFSAANERKPKPYYNYEPGIFRRHVTRSHLGHTFKGSFGITIELPVPDQMTLPGTDTAKPFERRVAERIVKGLLITQEASEKRDAEMIVSNYTEAFNGNMCESFLQMTSLLSSQMLGFELSWSPDIPVDDRLPTGEIPMRPVSDLIMSEAVVQLKATRSPDEDYLVYGLVTDLHKKAERDEQQRLLAEPRWVLVEWKTGNRPRKIRVYLLEDEWYDAACDAHRDNRPIKVLGKLEKKGGQLAMLEPKEFSVG